MRISDWSSDVCSSDLPALPGMGEGAFGAKDHERAVDREADIHHRSTDRSLDEDEAQPAHAGNRRRADIEAPAPPVETGSRAAYRADQLHRAPQQQDSAGAEMEADRDRSEERRVGKECGSTCRSRRSP